MTKVLWLATVEHVSIPGTRPAMFHQAKMPSDKAIKARFKECANARDLLVTGVFDLSHVCTHDALSLDAFNKEAIRLNGKKESK